MGREIDEVWIEEAVEWYHRIHTLHGELAKAAGGVTVRVSSPDGLVEVLVDGGGRIRDVVIGDDALRGRTGREVGRAVLVAVTAADDAAEWARQMLYHDTVRTYPEPPI